MRLVWQSWPGVVAAGWAFRITRALIPLAMLTVAKWILLRVMEVARGGRYARMFAQQAASYR